MKRFAVFRTAVLNVQTNVVLPSDKKLCTLRDQRMPTGLGHQQQEKYYFCGSGQAYITRRVKPTVRKKTAHCGCAGHIRCVTPSSQAPVATPLASKEAFNLFIEFTPRARDLSWPHRILRRRGSRSS